MGQINGLAENILLNTDTDYIVESGFDDSYTWYYEKTSNGIIKLFGTVNSNYLNPNLCVAYIDMSVLGVTKFLDAFTSANIDVDQIGNIRGSASYVYRENQPYTLQVAVTGNDVNAFTEGQVVPVSVQIIGKWKEIGTEGEIL